MTSLFGIFNTEGKVSTPQGKYFGALFGDDIISPQRKIFPVDYIFVLLCHV